AKSTIFPYTTLFRSEAGVKPEKGYRSMSTPHLVYPGQVDSFSYLNIGFFDNETEAENFRKYMMCKLPRFMMRTTYSSAHISQSRSEEHTSELQSRFD